MARIRTIKPGLFRHEQLYDAERTSKLPLRIAFAGLFTAADREGRFQWAPRALKLDCLPYDDCDFEDVLNALNEHGFIQKYEVNRKAFGFIPTWQIHQHVNVREVASTYPEPSDANICKNIPARGEGKGREQEGKGTDISTRNASVAADFIVFKMTYPKRLGSNPWQPAEKLFMAAVKSGTNSQVIINGVRAYHDECERGKIVGTEKVAQAQTWLRQARFLDYGAATDPTTRTIAPHSDEWLAERERRAAAGLPVAFMDAQAAKGNGWSVPIEQHGAAE